MAENTPQVQIIGRGKSQGAHKMQQVLEKIQPSQIPPIFLHSIVLTNNEGKKFKLSDDLIDRGFDYNNVSKEMRRLGLKDDVLKIEIYIDLDTAHDALEAETSCILDKYC